MRVLQITAFSGWGCTGRIALGINNVLERQGHKSVIAWGRINTAPYEVSTIKIGNKYDQIVHGLFTRITDKCGFGSKKVTMKFIKKIDEYNPDLIQLHIMHGYYINLEVLFNYIKEKNIPVVWTFHDCWAFTGHCPYFDLVECGKWKSGCNYCEQKMNHPKSIFLDNSKSNWNDKKRIFSGVKNMYIVTPSKWLAGLVKESFLKDYPVKVINNGINIGAFKPTKGNFKKKYNLEGKKIILGVSSSWVKSKGLDDFIKLSEVIDTSYRIVLVGLTKRQIEELPKEIIGIERTDSVKELAEIYTIAECFVNPTYEDNYPTTNIEAIACGTPVITYRTGGSIEIVEETGYGKVIEPGDIDGIVRALTQLSDLNYDDTQKYNEDIKFLEYVKLYEYIVGEKND